MAKTKKKSVTERIAIIKLGSTVVWHFATPREARSAQNMCNYVKNFCKMQAGVTGYATRREGSVLTITAI